MPPELEEIPVAENTPAAAQSGTIPLDSSFLDGLGVSLGIEDEVPSSSDAPSPAAEVTPPAAPAKPDRPEARERIKEKELRTKVEAYEKELEELRPLRTRVTELDTSLTETKTLAEQRAEEKRILEEAYRNETEVLPETVINELPEVQQAMETYVKAEKSLFPTALHDPNSGEPLRRFDPSRLGQAENAKIGELIKRWEHEEFQSQASPEVREDVQHVVISMIAQVLGVKTDNFSEKTVNGKAFPVIPPTHPVYNHIANNLLPFIEARNAAIETRNKAGAKAQEVIGTVVTKRIENSRKMFADLGITKRGDDLKAALTADPNNETLKALDLIHGHEDLAKELNDNIELELMANGHLRPNLDLAETDPKARTEKANVLKARIGLRAANAPLVGPLRKLAVRQQAQIAELKAKLEAAEAEASRTRQQAEPGSVISGDSDTRQGANDEWSVYGTILGI